MTHGNAAFFYQISTKTLHKNLHSIQKGEKVRQTIRSRHSYLLQNTFYFVVRTNVSEHKHEFKSLKLNALYNLIAKSLICFCIKLKMQYSKLSISFFKSTFSSKFHFNVANYTLTVKLCYTIFIVISAA